MGRERVQYSIDDAETDKTTFRQSFLLSYSYIYQDILPEDYLTKQLISIPAAQTSERRNEVVIAHSCYISEGY